MYGWRARIGRINPSPETVGDEEWRRLMPEGVIVVSTRMYIERVDAAGLTDMVTHVERAARELATARPNVILMAGTAGAFNGGLNFDAELSQRIERASGGVIGTTTMTAVLAALKAMGIRKLGIATSYIESMDKALATVLTGSGIEVLTAKGMGILKSIDMGDVKPEETHRFARNVFETIPGADGLLISCGNLRTLEVIAPLERDFKKPVITSNQAGLWHALRLAGVKVDGPALSIGGRLFTRGGVIAMKAVVVRQLGGPDVLRYEDVDDPIPQPDEALVKIEAAGVNFLDIYYRNGFHWGGHHKRALPYTPGAEGSGRVVGVGSKVTEVAVGDRVAFGVSNGYGAYAELIAIKSQISAKIPDALSARTASAVMQQGMTAHYLTNSTYPLKPNDVALVHAAAGGTGLLVVQMAKLRRARVIGVVSSERKAEITKSQGADETIVSPAQDFEQEARELTAGRGVDVVYDSTGKTTFEKSINCLAPLGMMVLYGQSSGAVPAFDTAILNSKGSLFLARPSLTHYVANRSDLESRTSDIFRWITEKKLNVLIDHVFPFREAPKSHELLESRKSIGKVLLVP